MKYRVEVHRSVYKDLDRVPAHYVSRIKQILQALQEDPRPPGVKKLRGQENTYRLRVGPYRILYDINDAEKRVYVHAVVHRREAYR